MAARSLRDLCPPHPAAAARSTRSMPIPARADLGNAVHEALAAFSSEHPQGAAADAEARIAARSAENSFAEWLSRPWRLGILVAAFRARRALVRRRGGGRRPAHRAERQREKGSLVIAAPAGPFTVTAIADRIDRVTDGGLVIIDYKTGGCRRSARSTTGLRRNCRSKARSPATAAFRRSPASRRRRSNTGGSAAASRRASASAIADGDPAALIDRSAGAG